MSKNSGCDVLEIKDGWAHIKSGKVNGYVKAEFLLTGQEARDRADKVANRYGGVQFRRTVCAAGPGERTTR